MSAKHTTGVMKHASLMGTIQTGFRDEAIFHCGLGLRHNSFVQEQEANARRITACWNACADVPVEVLEANASGGLPWLVADQIEARVERADLLEVLRRLHDWAQAQSSNTHYSGDHPIALARNMLRARAQETDATCRVCGTPPAGHGSYPTCASHPYTPDENCRHVIGARCPGAECKAKGCVRGAKSQETAS